jgi:hypothetical protein
MIAAELAAGDLSESWAREFCSWTDRLPDGQQAEADEILASAARAGVDLTGLAGLAREMYECSFHHLTVIHRWGWTLALDADGGITATSPDRARTLHDHHPPRAAA